jgi:hypothetical protein
MHEKPMKRDMVDDINPEGGHDGETTVEIQMHERPENRDGASSSCITYYVRQSSTKSEAVDRYVEIPVLNHLVKIVTPLSNPGPKTPEKRDAMTEYEKTEKKDVVDDIDSDSEKPEKRDVMIDINPEGEYNEEKTVKKQLYEKPEKRDMVVDINSEGKYDEEEVVEKQLVAIGDGPRLEKEEITAED